MKKDIKEMDEGLENKFLEMMKRALAEMKNENPLVFYKTLYDVIEKQSVTQEENKSKKQDETG